MKSSEQVSVTVISQKSTPVAHYPHFIVFNLFSSMERSPEGKIFKQHHTKYFLLIILNHLSGDSIIKYPSMKQVLDEILVDFSKIFPH